MYCWEGAFSHSKWVPTGIDSKMSSFHVEEGELSWGTTKNGFSYTIFTSRLSPQLLSEL